MKTITGGEAVIAVLEALGVKQVFGIVSVHNIPILDAVSLSSKISLVECRHEQGAIHAADGYARATGQIGVAITSTGPGAANAMGGLFEAYNASSPVLMITGQVESDAYGRGQGALHQAENQLLMLQTVTCRTAHISQHSEIVRTLISVVADMRSGRNRPAAIEIPIDIQYQTGEISPFEIKQSPHIKPPMKAIKEAVKLLNSAVRPLILAGGGVIASGATNELVAFAEILEAPVLTTVEGRGSIPENHRLALGPNTDLAIFNSMIADADVVFAIGTRFQQNNNTHKVMRFEGTLIHLDIDSEMLGRVHRPEVAILGDARIGLTELMLGIRKKQSNEEWTQRADFLREAAVSEARDTIGKDLRAILDSIEALIPDNSIIVKDATISAYLWANRLLKVFQPRSVMRPTSMAIGPGLPLAIGAASATNQPTVVIQGDGGLMLSIGELATVVQQRLPIVVCVFNDSGYGILRFIQNLTVNGRHTGVDLVTPRFAEVALAFGMKAKYVVDPQGFAEAFDEAISSGEPWLLDIDLTKMTPMEIRTQKT